MYIPVYGIDWASVRAKRAVKSAKSVTVEEDNAKI